ncbi:P-loop NTPase fold protein [Thiomicrorhabdus sp.]|uniref:KAP family P-loop NTPase fold protein n=1 Tax=Thiomicrorhabdus sp. TaxID=2039724 RepID=UPI00356A26F4
MANFNWKEEANIEGEIYSADILDRAKYAVFLTNHLVGEGEYRNYVLNLNAEWGAGKTYFLRRWLNELKTEHPVVYIDAWKHDFSDDPLLTTVGAIINQLEKQSGNNTDAMIRDSSRNVINLFKAVAPIIAKSLVKKASGIDTDEVLEASTGEKEPGEDDEVGSVTAEAAKKLTEAIINNHNQKAKSIDSFQKTISQWVDNATNTGELNAPAFIFIDELDRCRPTYAIEMLETIKHLFCMKKVVFVIATDTQQLQHSIKVVYGNEFDAETYLGRFFNRHLSLPVPDHISFIKTLPQSKHLVTLIKEHQWSVMPYYLDPDDIMATIGNFLKHYNLDLRTSERIFDQLFSILNQVTQSPHKKSIDLILTVAFLCWKERDYNFYISIKNRNRVFVRSVSDFRQYHPEYEQHHIDSFNIKFYFHLDAGIGSFEITFPSQPSTAPGGREILASHYIRYRYGQLIGQPIRPQDSLNQVPSAQNTDTSDLMRSTIDTNKDGYSHLSLEEYINLVELANLFDA